MATMQAKKSTEKSVERDGAVSLGREQLTSLLNEDLAREYQAIIAYVVYSQVLKGPQYMTIAGELENHAKQELEHALIIAKQIDLATALGQSVGEATSSLKTMSPPTPHG